jgi:hypothetical protein
MTKAFWNWLKEQFRKLVKSDVDIEGWQRLEFKDHKERRPSPWARR